MRSVEGAFSLFIVTMGTVSFGCSGPHLLLETSVLSHDATHLGYRVTVKNERQSGAFCTTRKFYGATAVHAYLLNAPRYEDATIRIAAGGVVSLGRPIPGDPNNAYKFRVIDVGETFSATLSNVTPHNPIDIQATPYLVFRFRSSTERNYGPIDQTGTAGNGCMRYGQDSVIDLRTLP